MSELSEQSHASDILHRIGSLSANAVGQHHPRDPHQAGARETRWPPAAVVDAEAEEAGSAKIVSVHGEIDAHSAPQLRACITEVTKEGQGRVIVDVEHMEFIDSTGLAVLVEAVKGFRPFGGQLILRRPNAHAMKVLRTTGIDRLVTVDG